MVRMRVRTTRNKQQQYRKKITYMFHINHSNNTTTPAENDK